MSTKQNKQCTCMPKHDTTMIIQYIACFWKPKRSNLIIKLQLTIHVYWVWTDPGSNTYTLFQQKLKYAFIKTTFVYCAILKTVCSNQGFLRALCVCDCNACASVWLSEYSAGIRSTTTLTESSLCMHTAPEPACLPKSRCGFVWLACLLFIPLPFRFLSLQLTRGTSLDRERKRLIERKCEKTDKVTERQTLCEVNPV